MLTTSISHLTRHIGTTLPVVSVGSGMGIEEQALVDAGRQVVCIEPTQQKRDRYLDDKVMTRRPDYPNVAAYLKANATHTGAVHLLLHYPLPDYILYDIQAIHDLKPKCITIMATMGGSSGSFWLHVWLRQCGVRTLGKAATEKSMAWFLDVSAVVVDEYRVVKFEVLPANTGNDRQCSDKGVPNERFLATLMRAVPYTPAPRVVSPQNEERICLGGMHTTQELRKAVEYGQYLVQARELVQARAEVLKEVKAIYRG